MTTSQTAHPTEGEIERIVRAFDEAWLPEPRMSQLRTEWANYDRSKNDPAHPNRVSSKRWRDHRVACMRAALSLQPSRPQGEEGLWRPSSEAPAVSVGDERGFIVAVRRAHSGKVYSFAAIYLNAKPLLFEDEEEERPVTGWHDITADEDRGDAYHQTLTAGDELIAWREIPQFAALSNQGEPSS